MNQDSKKKIGVLLICAVVILEIEFYQYEDIQTKQDIGVSFKTTNQVEANIDFNKKFNITELDIKLLENLKQAADKKVSLFLFSLSFNLACKKLFSD